LHLEDGRHVVEQRHRRGEQHGASTTGQAGGDVQLDGGPSQRLPTDAHAQGKDALDRQLVLDDVRAAGARLALLPDEPYAFGPADAAEVAREGVRVDLVDGKLLGWYGRRLGGIVEIAERIARAAPAPTEPSAA
jgi:hypothetical protein